MRASERIAGDRVDTSIYSCAAVPEAERNALPVLAANPDLRYTAQSVVFVAWSVLAPAVVTWKPRYWAKYGAPRRGEARTGGAGNV